MRYSGIPPLRSKFWLTGWSLMVISHFEILHSEELSRKCVLSGENLKVSPFLKTSPVTLPFQTQLSTVYFWQVVYVLSFFLSRLNVCGIKGLFDLQRCVSILAEQWCSSLQQLCDHFSSSSCPFSTCFYKIWVYQQSRSNYSVLFNYTKIQAAPMSLESGDTLYLALYSWFSHMGLLSGRAGSKARQQCIPGSSSLKYSLTNHLPASLGAVWRLKFTQRVHCPKDHSTYLACTMKGFSVLIQSLNH